MRYNKIRTMDISNGPGIRVSIFMQGCPFHCYNCFNPETWNFDGGEEFTDETIQKILKLCERDYIAGLSILGGEPLHEKNIDAVTKLAQVFKQEFPNKNLWVWTGNLYENLETNEVMEYIDVLIDGQYKDELRNPTLKWKGSSNQRVIDIQKTIAKKQIVQREE